MFRLSLLLLLLLLSFELKPAVQSVAFVSRCEGGSVVPSRQGGRRISMDRNINWHVGLIEHQPQFMQFVHVLATSALCKASEGLWLVLGFI